MLLGLLIDEGRRFDLLNGNKDNDLKPVGNDICVNAKHPEPI